MKKAWQGFRRWPGWAQGLTGFLLLGLIVSAASSPDKQANPAPKTAVKGTPATPNAKPASTPAPAKPAVLAKRKPKPGVVGVPTNSPPPNVSEADLCAGDTSCLTALDLKHALNKKLRPQGVHVKGDITCQPDSDETHFKCNVRTSDGNETIFSVLTDPSQGTFIYQAQ